MYMYEGKGSSDGRERVGEGGNCGGYHQESSSVGGAGATCTNTNGLEGGISTVEAELGYDQMMMMMMGQQCFDSSNDRDADADADAGLSYEIYENLGGGVAAAAAAAAAPPPPDLLLNLFHLPPPSNSSSAGITFTNPDSCSGILYDPLFHLPPTQPPAFRELFQSLPHAYNLTAATCRVGSLLDGVVVGERDHHQAISTGGGDDDHHDINGGVLKFTRGMTNCGGINGKAGGCREVGKRGTTKPFATEKQRREHLNDKYSALKSLVPNPTKNDRASVVGDAIDYIKELLRTVKELKLLVEKKRCGREMRRRRRRRRDEEDEENDDAGVKKNNYKNSSNSNSSSSNSTSTTVIIKAEEADHHSGSYNDSLRSSWLQRKSKDTEVDVRIVDDQVTIKLVQRKKINCLLFVSKILDDLQLDLHHVAGGHVGDYYSFLFNTKIYEGSSVYASSIANKLIDAVDRHYAPIPTPPTF